MSVNALVSLVKKNNWTMKAAYWKFNIERISKKAICLGQNICWKNLDNHETNSPLRKFRDYIPALKMNDRQTSEPADFATYVSFVPLPKMASVGMDMSLLDWKHKNVELAQTFSCNCYVLMLWIQWIPAILQYCLITKIYVMLKCTALWN